MRSTGGKPDENAESGFEDSRIKNVSFAPLVRNPLGSIPWRHGSAHV